MVVGDATGEYELRPLMTGDVLERSDGNLVALVQHPCAIRSDGVTLLDRLLVCEVVPLDSDLRTSWKNEPYYRMALTQFAPVVQIDFRKPVVLRSEEVTALRRVAVMEREGINLLMQRWVHHNTRVIVKTVSYDEMCIGPYAEVDLIAEALAELVPGGIDATEALSVVDKFLSAPLSDADRRDTWRNRLKKPDQRGPAQRALDAHLRDLLG